MRLTRHTPGTNSNSKGWAKISWPQSISVLDRIGQNPEVHAPIYQAIRHSRVKKFPYAVYYRVEPDRIAIIAVHHNKRDPKTWRSRT